MKTQNQQTSGESELKGGRHNYLHKTRGRQLAAPTNPYTLNHLSDSRFHSAEEMAKPEACVLILFQAKLIIVVIQWLTVKLPRQKISYFLLSKSSRPQNVRSRPTIRTTISYALDPEASQTPLKLFEVEVHVISAT